MLRLIFATLFLGSVGLGADQIPPFSIEPSDECHIADAKPLLDKAKYKNDSASYALQTLSKSPLVLLETIKLDDGSALMIEQRGCEDIYFKFRHELKVKTSKNKFEQIKEFADLLTKLYLSKKSLINQKQIQEIAKKVKLQVSKEKKLKDFTICLMKVSQECITDVKVTATSSEIEFFYVDRP